MRFLSASEMYNFQTSGDLLF